MSRPSLDKILLRISSSPLVRLLGIEIVKAASGYALVALNVKERHLNSLGTLHGGVIASLNDVACGIAVNTLLTPGFTGVSLDLRVEFINPAGIGKVHCEARVSEKKTRVAFASSKMRDEEGNIISTASATYFIRPFEENG